LQHAARHRCQAFGAQLQREVQDYTKLARELDLKAE